MNVIPKILIGIGLLTTVAGNLATRYGLNTFIKTMAVSAEEGIAAPARAIDMTFIYNAVSLVGCFLLIAGLAMAALSRRQRP